MTTLYQNRTLGYSPLLGTFWELHCRHWLSYVLVPFDGSPLRFPLFLGGHGHVCGWIGSLERRSRPWRGNNKKCWQEIQNRRQHFVGRLKEWKIAFVKADSPSLIPHTSFFWHISGCWPFLDVVVAAKGVDNLAAILTINHSSWKSALAQMYFTLGNKLCFTFQVFLPL